MALELIPQAVEIAKIVTQLDENAQFHQNSQEQLLAFCRNKDFPLIERFNVWTKYVNKEKHPWIIHETTKGCGIIGKMVDECWPCDYDRYRYYTWEDFLSWVEEYIEEKEAGCDDTERPCPFQGTLNEFKEILMEQNFGGYDHDW